MFGAMNAIILHNDNARIITLINILITSLCRFGIDVATPGRHWILSRGPNSHLITLNVIVLQVQHEHST